MESGALSARRASRVSRASLPDDMDDDDASLDNWKPSVYWVMLYLTLASVVLASCAAAVYSPFEDWSFFESIYFCFVSFATIGFGDYVSTQVSNKASVHSIIHFRSLNSHSRHPGLIELRPVKRRN